MTLLWVLNLADGRHTLLDMAERAGQPFAAVRAAADAAIAVGPPGSGVRGGIDFVDGCDPSIVQRDKQRGGTAHA